MGPCIVEIDRIVIREVPYQFEEIVARTDRQTDAQTDGHTDGQTDGGDNHNIPTLLKKRKMPRPLGGHFFSPTGTIFELIQDIIRTNHLTKFHDDRTINLASRELTKKNAPPPDIIRKNLLTKFHEDRKINVASRVLTRKNAPPPCGHFHEDRTINVDSRVKNAPPLGIHVFQANVTIFKLIQDITETNLLTKFHEDWTINLASRVKNAPPLGSHENCPAPPGGDVFSPIWTIFELVRDINITNVLTNFHDDWANIVTSRVFTGFLYSHIRNTAPPPGGHVFQRTGTIFELNQHIIETNILTNFKLSRGINGTNVLTKLHEDQTLNVASRVFTRQNVDDARRMTHSGQKAITNAHHEHVVFR
ncbi:hypothetical protein DPMN_160058 [Dreissena polymorpha]|uniref:Uncharacterized protein n=1 Tax=Dreissena polymorpha TaxID=45954 RepID=A0A9D4EQH0_DREPO|nr:hypothetical protein DPMN_160058 [Dreissena polymorpha]